MKTDLGKCKEMQAQIARQVVLDCDIDKVKYVAGFDISYRGNQCVCAVVVMNADTLEIVEKKTITAKQVMSYVPGFEAFREGPLICQLYFDLETDPDVIMVDGHGIAHEQGCGLATFVGVELGKPAIGVAKNMTVGEEKDGMIFFGEEIIGAVVKTKEHANPVYVSVGNMISLEKAAEIVKKCVVAPHKLPEPVHVAHRLADKTLASSTIVMKKSERLIESE